MIRIQFVPWPGSGFRCGSGFYILRRNLLLLAKYSKKIWIFSAFHMKYSYFFKCIFGNIFFPLQSLVISYKIILFLGKKFLFGEFIFFLRYSWRNFVIFCCSFFKAKSRLFSYFRKIFFVLAIQSYFVKTHETLRNFEISLTNNFMTIT